MAFSAGGTNESIVFHKILQGSIHIFIPFGGRLTAFCLCIGLDDIFRDFAFGNASVHRAFGKHCADNVLKFSAAETIRMLYRRSCLSFFKMVLAVFAIVFNDGARTSFPDIMEIFFFLP